MPFNPAAPLIPLWLTVFGFSLLLAAVQLIHPVRRLLPLQSRVTLVLALLTVSLPASGAATGLPLLSDGRLGWVLATFVIGLTAVIQAFSIRFLQGDVRQSRAFAWLTFLMAGGVAAWLASDTRLLLAGWGLVLFALTRLIGFADDWPAARAAARHASGWFLAAWTALAGMILIASTQTGGWTGSVMNAVEWSPIARHLGAALLLLAVLIPAAQWPAQRWLLTTMVAPTPVSAIMHAGVVNAGGILLVRFGGLLAVAEWARIVLLFMSSASILLGAGMLMVQVDVKRQLAASTIAQMGCMLLQCALGAYHAAIIHLLLHGLYKASLFLQAGGAIHAEYHGGKRPHGTGTIVLAVITGGLLLWLNPSWAAGPAGWLSALLLSWTAARALANTEMLQWRNLPFWMLVLGGFLIVQTLLHGLLGGEVPHGTAPGNIWVYAAALMLVCGTLALYRVARGGSTPFARRAYWLLVHLSEAPVSTIDPHPSHLARRVRQGAYA